MGINGSSTCSLILEECRVPAENLLGEPGKGHEIAFNILNVGRFKLGAANLGGTKSTIDTALAYALERKQFGTPSPSSTPSGGNWRTWPPRPSPSTPSSIGRWE